MAFIIDSKFTDYDFCCITKTMVGGWVRDDKYRSESRPLPTAIWTCILKKLTGSHHYKSESRPLPAAIRTCVLKKLAGSHHYRSESRPLPTAIQTCILKKLAGSSSWWPSRKELHDPS